MRFAIFAACCLIPTYAFAAERDCQDLPRFLCAQFPDDPTLGPFALPPVPEDMPGAPSEPAPGGGSYEIDRGEFFDRLDEIDGLMPSQIDQIQREFDATIQ